MCLHLYFSDSKLLAPSNDVLDAAVEEETGTGTNGGLLTVIFLLSVIPRGGWAAVTVETGISTLLICFSFEVHISPVPNRRVNEIMGNRRQQDSSQLEISQLRGTRGPHAAWDWEEILTLSCAIGS